MSRCYHLCGVLACLPCTVTHLSPHALPLLTGVVHISLQGVVYCVWSCYALEKMHRTPKVITLASIGNIPYENRFVRSLVDGCAFHIYGHWVKRGEEQNRALLFETAPKKLSQMPGRILSGFIRPRTLVTH